MKINFPGIHLNHVTEHKAINFVLDSNLTEVVTVIFYVTTTLFKGSSIQIHDALFNNDAAYPIDAYPESQYVIKIESFNA